MKPPKVGLTTTGGNIHRRIQEIDGHSARRTLPFCRKRWQVERGSKQQKRREGKEKSDLGTTLKDGLKNKGGGGGKSASLIDPCFQGKLDWDHFSRTFLLVPDLCGFSATRNFKGRRKERPSF